MYLIKILTRNINVSFEKENIFPHSVMVHRFVFRIKLNMDVNFAGNLQFSSHFKKKIKLYRTVAAEDYCDTTDSNPSDGLS